MTVNRGDIFMADLPAGRGSEQHGKRPVVIIQNDVGNKHSPTVIAVVITSAEKHNLPTHMNYKLFKESTITCEQIFTLSKERLGDKVGRLKEEEMKELEIRTMISLGIIPPHQWDKVLKQFKSK